MTLISSKQNAISSLIGRPSLALVAAHFRCETWVAMRYTI
ncbi:hypothetical protein RISK_005974 [Rhodopirellula islandica]|uniref:Uncharacterized protein n=1 Tax=Rhodopirellula islandica TaxID=595434 RepID=A0A0J1E921_RHOIS|nr:hypothetical protein RISK_005974 [Rhodopirellula islandica]